MNVGHVVDMYPLYIRFTLQIYVIFLIQSHSFFQIIETSPKFLIYVKKTNVAKKPKGTSAKYGRFAQNYKKIYFKIIRIMGMHSLFDNFFIQFFYNFEAVGRPTNRGAELLLTQSIDLRNLKSILCVRTGNRLCACSFHCLLLICLFSRRMRRTLWSMRCSVSTPSSTALTTASKAPTKFCGPSTMSAPA